MQWSYVIRVDGKKVNEFKHARSAGALHWRLKCQEGKSAKVFRKNKITKKEILWFD